MPEYLYPGVYVEEVDTGNKPIEGVSTSTVGFLGIAERGPLDATLVTSFTEFTRSFGKYVNEAGKDRYLAYAVEGFFQNGGLRCFIARVAPAKAKAAHKDFDAKVTVTAIGPGAWGKRIAVGISAAGNTNPNLFKLTIAYWADAAPNPLLDGNKNFTTAPTQIEVFDNLSPVPASSAFYERQVTWVSNLVTVKKIADGVPAAADPVLLDQGGDVGDAYALTDFEGDASVPDSPTGLAALAAVDEISILCCPDEDAFAPKTDIAQQLVLLCENMKDRFAILNSPQSAPKPDKHSPSVASKYAAYYYPWLDITNAVTGQTIVIPPGGHIAGIYARSDTNRGVHKDPANEQIFGLDDLQVQITNQQQAILNPKGVNALRYFKGAGNLVWGGRTTSIDPDWKYINVRRLFIFVEKSIERGTQWVVFEPNDEPTWARVRRSVGDFLTRLWMDGMLQGATKEQAYFVRCDRTTMTQADIDNGRLIVLIGIAPVKPAEFVIFRIGQWTGGSDVTEQ
jgi:phage tail sheath protein FI